MTAKYRDYAMGPVELDAETGTLSGTVAGLRDVVHFTGATGAELVQAFRDSVDDYLAFCAERGESPEKPYSGRLLVRLNPTLHREATIQASMEGLSLNAWIERQIEHAAGGPPRRLPNRLTSEPATAFLLAADRARFRELVRRAHGADRTKVREAVAIIQPCLEALAREVACEPCPGPSWSEAEPAPEPEPEPAPTQAPEGATIPRPGLPDRR